MQILHNLSQLQEGNYTILTTIFPTWHRYPVLIGLGSLFPGNECLLLVDIDARAAHFASRQTHH